MLKTTFRLRHQVRPIFAERGLTGPQWRVFRMIGECSAEGLTPGQISDRLGVTNGNTTGIVDKLEEAGLVQRLPHPDDRRATLLQMTEVGRNTYDEVRPVLDQRVSELLGTLSVENKTEMIALLSQLLDSLPDDQGCSR
jgi:DNA-binding MarR family transcriptional regulator